MAGEAVAREHQLLAVYVTKSVNKISAARLIYLDGAASAGDFPLSNAGTFVPGAEIEILAGPGRAPVSLFQGVVVRQGLKVREQSAPQLAVECRHRAVKMTGARKSAYFFDQTDGDIIGALLEKGGIEGDVENMPLSHKQLVQYFATDWDFLLLRAEANGKWVFTNDDKVTVKSPQFGGEAVCMLQFGATLLDLDIEMDARSQYETVKSVTWDPSQQAPLEKEAADPGPVAPGNLSSADLAAAAGSSPLLQNGALTEEEAQAWADAHWLKSKVSKISGRAKCEGIGIVNPGEMVALSGIGERYTGKVFVTGVRHDYDLVQGWKTHLQFGRVEKWLAEETDISLPRAGALLPAVHGLQIGVVVSNEDPEGEDRVRVRMPLIDNQEEGTWARVAVPDAGNERGFFFRPEVGDEAILGFLNDDPRQAVILGMLHSSAKPAPLQGSDQNHEKVYQSRSKMKLFFNDEKKIMHFETPAGNKITLTEEDKALRLEDQNGNKIEMTSDGIKIESIKAIELKAATEVKMESGTSFGAKAGTELKLEGAAGAELSSTAATKVKGSVLQLN